MRREVSVAIFYNKENKILLQNREGISKWGEEWAFFGGGIEENETPEQALIREIEEELTYKVKEFSFFKKHIFETEEHHFELNIFLIHFANTSQFEQKEGKEMALFSLEEAKNLKMMPQDNEVIKDLQVFFNNKDKV